MSAARPRPAGALPGASTNGQAPACMYLLIEDNGVGNPTNDARSCDDPCDETVDQSVDWSIDGGPPGDCVDVLCRHGLDGCRARGARWRASQPPAIPRRHPPPRGAPDTSTPHR